MQRLDSGQKLKLGFYPYTYVRTVVMRSLLFKRDDYIKMLKMSYSEIAKFMQESSYKKDINALAASYSGSDLLELAINRNLSETFKKLLRISMEELGILVKEYARRKDMDDLKTILRGKFTNTDKKTIERSLTAAGNFSMGFLTELMGKENVEQILKSSNVIDQEKTKALLINFEKEKNLVQIENTLDKLYYLGILKFADSLSEEGVLFKEMIVKEVEIMNILTLVRLMREKLPAKEISDFLIMSGSREIDSRISTIARAETLEEIEKIMTRTEYAEIFEEGMEEYRKKGSLIKLETGLSKYLLNKSVSMIHLNLLSVDTIIGFMFAKEIEARNMKILIKGKQLGLQEDFIIGQLIF